jgi:hypothetical protein
MRQRTFRGVVVAAGYFADPVRPRAVWGEHDVALVDALADCPDSAAGKPSGDL